MTNLNIMGTGAILPAGSPVATLPEGAYSVTIDGIDDSGLFRCVYPDGFIKHHQAASVAELADAIARQVKGRYGVAEVVFAGVPEGLEAGQSFTVEG